MPESRAEYRSFYESGDSRHWGREEMPQQREVTLRWLHFSGFAKVSAKIVELGCGMGPLADVHESYVGLEFSGAALKLFRNRVPRVNGDMQQLPFKSGSVDFVFSWAALEHVPAPALVLDEVTRVLRPGGVALLAPAWNCRSWAAKGLPAKQYRDLGWKDRASKASIPFRDSVLWRALWAVPARLMRELKAKNGPLRFEYKTLTPNLKDYVYTDCDAFTSMDPHSAILYFRSRGWHILSHQCFWTRMSSRHEPVIVRKP